MCSFCGTSCFCINLLLVITSSFICGDCGDVSHILLRVIEVLMNAQVLCVDFFLENLIFLFVIVIIHFCLYPVTVSFEHVLTYVSICVCIYLRHACACTLRCG